MTPSRPGIAGAPGQPDRGTPLTWEKPALERFPLNDAQTGIHVGADSDTTS
jgi:hypothetical protein